MLRLLLLSSLSSLSSPPKRILLDVRASPALVQRVQTTGGRSSCMLFLVSDYAARRTLDACGRRTISTCYVSILVLLGFEKESHVGAKAESRRQDLSKSSRSSRLSVR